jgi:hypothetical protein
MSPLYRWVIKWSRTIHLYLTLFGLALLLLFAVTGFMLNHEDWFINRDKPYSREIEGVQLPLDILQKPDELKIVELLRKDHGATGALEVFEVPKNEEEHEIRVTFKQPGRSFEATIDKETGELKAKYTSDGLVGILLDLHRVKSTGLVWKLIVDGLVVMLLVISVTGLVLWWSLKGRGHWPAITLVLGTVALIGAYLAFVP